MRWTLWTALEKLIAHWRAWSIHLPVLLLQPLQELVVVVVVRVVVDVFVAQFCFADAEDSRWTSGRFMTTRCKQ